MPYLAIGNDSDGAFWNVQKGHRYATKEKAIEAVRQLQTVHPDAPYEIWEVSPQQADKALSEGGAFFATFEGYLVWRSQDNPPGAGEQIDLLQPARWIH